MLAPPLTANRLTVTPIASTFPVIDRLLALISPTTLNALVGLLVPIPTFPPINIPAYLVPPLPLTSTLRPVAVALESNFKLAMFMLTPVALYVVTPAISPIYDPAPLLN
jgi:hypothetical protein